MLLLLESGIDKNAKNWRGLTAMDCLRDQTQVDNRVTLEILNYYGCLSASSIPTRSSFDKFLRSEISFSEKSNIVVSRMRKNILNSTRNALLVMLVLILTATYQSAVNPPYDLVQAKLRQTNNGDIPIPFDTPSNQQGSSGTDPNDLVEIKMDPVALSISIFNAVDFMVTLLVTIFILPLVPYGQLLHVLLLLVFIFFLASIGLSFALTTSIVGIAIFVSFIVITIVVGFFIVMNSNRNVYRECIKEIGDRVRIRKHNNIKK
ncbi:hypothetical protein PTKIN_Ptkin13bG0185200 [Pterospermum kingtungense]